MAVARNVWGYIDQRDRRIMRRVNRWQAPRWVRILMIAWTKLGDGLLWYAVGLALLVFGGERGIHAFLASAAAAFGSIALFRQVKRLSRRARPCHVEPHCWAIITPPDQFSFPSGHAMTSFAIAVALTHFYPDFEPLLIFCAVSVGLSRIVLGMHYLTDVIAGALIGVGLGLLSVAVLH